MEYYFNILFIGLALSADSFSAALAMGFRPHKTKDSLKFALASGGAEAIAALAGALAGKGIIARFSEYDHWVAFGILLAVALHMGKEGIEDLLSPAESSNESFHSFKKILLVSMATSLDALGVGVGLGVASQPLAPYIVSIGVWAAFSTVLGMYLAKRVPRRYGPIANIVGAIILVILAIKMLST